MDSPVPAYSLIDEVGRERAFAEPAAALAELAGAIAQVSRRAEPAVAIGSHHVVDAVAQRSGTIRRTRSAGHGRRR